MTCTHTIEEIANFDTLSDGNCPLCLRAALAAAQAGAVKLMPELERICVALNDARASLRRSGSKEETLFHIDCAEATIRGLRPPAPAESDKPKKLPPPWDGYRPESLPANEVYQPEPAGAPSELVIAAQGLVDRLDYIHADPAYKSVWTVSQLHVGPYQGPTYEADLVKLRSVLALLQRGKE
jgi:hypothetical protein